MKRVIFSLVIVLMLVMTGLLVANLPSAGGQPAAWPTTWTWLSTDPDESGGSDHRDVFDTNGDGYALYYTADSQYLYLRMETVDPPGWPSTGPQGEARYKWWFDTGGTAAYLSGTTVYDAEFQLILEDRTNTSNVDGSRDQLGELTLVDDLQNVGFTSRWNQGNSGWYITNTPDNDGPSSLWKRALGSGTAGTGGPQGVMGSGIGYRIDDATTGGHFVDMYISWAALGNPSSLCLIWATDTHNTNLNQAPNLDRPEGTSCLPTCAPLNADFYANNTTCCVNQSVTFTSNSTGNATSWNWSFGDGGTSTTQNPTHSYASASTYTVTLNVSNACFSDIETKTNYISVNPTPVANFSANVTTGCEPLAVRFTDTSTGNPTSWSWSFPGGNPSSANAQGSHTVTYNSPGIYNVTLSTTNAFGCSDDEARTNYITVNPKPVANFSANVTTGCEPLIVRFTDTSTGNPTSWSWSFPGGNPSSANTQGPHTVTYNSPGIYNVTLSTTNAFGCSDDEAKTNYITVNPKPVANFSANATSGCAPLTIQFTDTSTGSPSSWSWNFGDGSNSTAQNATHQYNSAGTYNVSLTATNACGNNTKTVNNYIIVTQAPTANFSANVASGCAPLTIQFTDTSTGSPTGWSWNFTGGNPSSANTQGPHTVTYNSPGTYNITLTVSNACGNDTETKTNYITVDVPDIDVSPTSKDFGSVQVTTSSAPQTFNVTNIGTANLTVGAVTITGANSDQFSKQIDNVSGQTITPGGWATLQVVFSPTSVGLKSATLNISSNDPDENPLLVALNGTGSVVAIPDIDVSPTSKDFGSVQVTTSSAPQTFNVTNIGTANLTVGAVTITGANSDQFSKQIDNVSGQTITPGGWATLQVVFSPTSVGLKSATLNITSNDPDENPFTVDLSGTGTSTPAGPAADAADSGGTPKNEFTTSEEVYASGTGFQPGTNVTIYVVSATDCCCTKSNCTCLEYGATLSDLDVSGGAETATTNPNGSLSPTLVWGTTAGEYALVFDVEPYGVYDEGDLCCGFTIIAPVGGTAYPINKLIILAPWIALAAAAAIGIAILSRRRRAQS